MDLNSEMLAPQRTPPPGTPKTALNYSVAPGAYVLTIKIPGEQPQTKKLDIASGTAWGVMALPTGGYLASQLY